MRHYLLLPMFFSVLFAGGCTPKQYKEPPPPPSRAAQAEKLLQTGEPTRAAQLYQQLAEQKSSNQNLYRLLAAESLFKSGNSGDAKKYIDTVEPEKLTQGQRNRLNLLKAQIDLSFGEAERALSHLDRISVRQLNRTDIKSYYQSRAFAYSLAGELLKSARQRIALSQYIDDRQRLYDNYTAILESLTLLSDQTLQTMQPPPPDSLGGWMALARVVNSKKQYPEYFENAVNEWRRNFPQHPANSGYLETYFAKSRRIYQQPSAIAVLLPESGPYASAGKAIRAGFEAAYNRDGQSFKPQIRYYDSAAADPATLYRQALANGADLVIGPLNKKNISRLIDTTELTTPVLALNHVPGLVKNNLYQFGLSPIDDAEQVVNKALSDGHKKALLLVPNTELGKRLTGYYSEFWQNSGGSILEVQVYNAKDNDFSTPIRQLLNLDESENRYNHIRRLIPGVHFAPRRRHDADAIFISGSPNTARLLNPQLHFYRANDIPVYATAQIYGSRPNPAKDIDLNGITFCDMPWLFDDNYRGNLGIGALRQSRLQVSNAHLKLVALGIDAYHLASHLSDLSGAPYAGATGHLVMTGDYRIKRKLLCAKFVRGYPQPLDFVNEPINEFSTVDTVDIPDANPFHVQ